MKVSISLTERQLVFIDDKVARGVYRSRSAAIAAGVRRLQERDLEADYAASNKEWADSGEQAFWDQMLMDGLEDEGAWWE